MDAVYQGGSAASFARMGYGLPNDLRVLIREGCPYRSLSERAGDLLRGRPYRRNDNSGWFSWLTSRVPGRLLLGNLPANLTRRMRRRMNVDVRIADAHLSKEVV